jgi:hypothetical protein
MPEYDTLPHVIAKIRARIGSGGWHEFGPGDAKVVKDQAAAWFRAQRFTRTNTRIGITLAQESPQVPWTDAGTWRWSGEATHGQEYAAQWCERFPEWGRGR